MVQSLVEKWLSDFRIKTRKEYEARFRMFEDFTGKSGDELLRTSRENITDLEHMDDVSRLLFQFSQALLDGKIPQRARGSAKGSKPLKGKTLDGVGYSQKSVAVMLGSIKSFFSYYNVPIKMGKFNRKDIRLRNPQPQTRKYLFTKSDLEKLFALASLRDKALIMLGLMGQDASTLSALRIEEIKPALDNGEATKVKVLELTRRKTNMTIGLVLTPEVQKILRTYVDSLGRQSGWLFSGYNDEHLRPSEIDRVLKTLCRAARIESNGKRLSSHCLRAWFSTQLKSLISDDLINYAQGHRIAYDSAYLLEAQSKFSDARILEALRIIGGQNEDNLRRQETRILESLKRNGIINDGQLASIYIDLGLMGKLPAEEKFISTKPIT